MNELNATTQTEIEAHEHDRDRPRRRMLRELVDALCEADEELDRARAIALAHRELRDAWLDPVCEIVDDLRRHLARVVVSAILDESEAVPADHELEDDGGVFTVATSRFAVTLVRGPHTGRLRDVDIMIASSSVDTGGIKIL